MRKFLALLSFLVFLAPYYASSADAAVNLQGKVDTSNLAKGIVGVKYTSTQGKKVKVAVEKENKIYYYDLPNNGTVNYFPLQMQNGTYKISIYEQTKDNQYMPVQQTAVGLQMKNQFQMYKQSTQNVNWNATMLPIKKAHDLTYKLKTDEAKVMAIYGYITKNVKYDYVKLKNVKSGYLPNVVTTYKTNKGICYDYSSLFAAMLRSQGIPAKLVTGYSKNVKEFHAWNEVYIQELKRWVIIDTTIDASAIQRHLKPSVFKPASQYKKTNEY
ncbi:MAG: transglutaminase-like domain-containing protein [Bacillota bacterium]|nr:transglutaminase-like domain-containing protein [Bacillota bacterium]MDP4172101.1 transglutaminase-like domain-containing protein [Bacillota bacterium]